MKGKYSRFYAILKAANTAGLLLTKEEAVSEYTSGRTESLSALSSLELEGLERYIQSATAGHQLHIPPADTCDKMRKGIISIFYSIGRSVADAKAWAEKYGTGGKKKAFNDYDEAELYQLLRNAEKMKADHISSVNKRLTEEA